MSINKTGFICIIYLYSSSSPFGLSLQSGVATPYHHSPNLSVIQTFICIQKFKKSSPMIEKFKSVFIKSQL